MKHIFYFVGLFYIIYGLAQILNPIKQTEKNKKLYEGGKEHKGKDWNEYPSEYKNLVLAKLIPVFTFGTWSLIGLMTFNWVAFLFKFTINLILVPFYKLTRFNYVYTTIHWIDSLFGVIFGVFVIINTYHLKIDLYSWVLNLFQ